MTGEKLRGFTSSSQLTVKDRGKSHPVMCVCVYMSICSVVVFFKIGPFPCGGYREIYKAHKNLRASKSHIWRLGEDGRLLGDGAVPKVYRKLL